MTSNNILIQHLTKAYNKQVVLSDLSFEFPYGEITAILAPSGSGKTTLLRILLGLETQDSGTMKGLENLKKSAVFQEDRLCENLSALANLKLVTKDKSKEELIHAMEQVGLFDCSQKTIKELSGGMKRRVAILRALLADYDLLILDEPFKGLDNNTKQLVINYMKKQIIEKTVIFVTHDECEVKQLGATKILQY